ncbi:hypothetical protein M514_15303, partial [Trichuris suis]
GQDIESHNTDSGNTEWSKCRMVRILETETSNGGITVQYNDMRLSCYTLTGKDAGCTVLPMPKPKL